LVQFLPIYSAKEWVDCLLQFKKYMLEDKDIAEALNQSGFSAATNAQKLTQVYLSM